MPERELTIRNGDVDLAVTERGTGERVLVLLHGLAGSSRELLPTAAALGDEVRVILIDQRGHGRSTRRPHDLSRAAFVGDVVTVIEQVSPDRPVILVGQSMGAHTAFLTAATRPDLVERLIMLEGHVAASDDPEEAARLGAYFASWPETFADEDHARAVLGPSPLTEAWIDDFERTPDGCLRPRFDADVMRRTIEAVHESRWVEWEALETPTLAIFTENGMFSQEQRAELVRRRPATRVATMTGASHDAHLDSFDGWIAILRDELAAHAVEQGKSALTALSRVRPATDVRAELGELSASRDDDLQDDPH
ncbi:MAG: alpha/beta hydrolase [Microbacterium sp.]